MGGRGGGGARGGAGGGGGGGAAAETPAATSSVAAWEAARSVEEIAAGITPRSMGDADLRPGRFAYSDLGGSIGQGTITEWRDPGGRTIGYSQRPTGTSITGAQYSGTDYRVYNRSGQALGWTTSPRTSFAGEIASRRRLGLGDR